MNDMLNLNNPDTRQALLQSRLAGGTTLIAADLADEFQVSLDTVRRDLLSLERRGVLKRVKGGAVPVVPPSPPLAERLGEGGHWLQASGPLIASLIADTRTIVLDGGTSVMAFARQLPVGYAGQIITPSPLVASIGLERGIEVYLIGGRLCASGGIAVGGTSEQAVAACSADLCVLGVCGLDAGYGLFADDCDEAGMKSQMAAIAGHVLVLAERSKLNKRARYHVCRSDRIGVMVTNAPPADCAAFAGLDMDIHHV